jgi:hypothetical protein
MEVDAKEGEGPAVDGKEKMKKSAKEQKEVERARQVDEGEWLVRLDILQVLM